MFRWDLFKSPGGDATSVVIAGGGPSIRKYAADITRQLERHPNWVLFDLNGHYAMREYEYLKLLDNPKYLFATKFGNEGSNFNRLYNRVRKFLKLTNGYFFCEGHASIQTLAKHLGDHVLFYYPVEDVGMYECGLMTTWGHGGLNAALGAIPSTTKEVHLYGCDAVSIGEWRSMLNGTQPNPEYSAKNMYGLSFMTLLAQTVKLRFYV